MNFLVFVEFYLFICLFILCLIWSFTVKYSSVQEKRDNCFSFMSVVSFNNNCVCVCVCVVGCWWVFVELLRQTKDVVKAVKRRLQHKIGKVQLLALTVILIAIVFIICWLGILRLYWPYLFLRFFYCLFFF